MTEAIAVKPDLEFKNSILALGAHDLTACYQCGTCSVVCPISTDADPFPRKDMIWVQWGLKDRLLADPAIWLCHQCGLCSTYCPRDAKPSNVMASLRDYSITHYAFPQFLGRAVSQAKYLPLLFAFPALIFLAVLAWLGNLTSLPTGQIVYSKFMPMIYIEIIFVLGVGAAVINAIGGGRRYWKAMNRRSGAPANESSRKSVITTLVEVFKHRRFSECERDRVGTLETHKSHQHKTHLAVFYGFLGLFVTTTLVFIGIYAFGYLTPWPLWHPVKILGNVSGVAVVVACCTFIYRRLVDKELAGKSTYSDWLLLGVLTLTALTGFLSELLRLADIPPLAYWIYFAHLVFIFSLLVYTPYSKFAHLIYRLTAMLHASGRPAN